jgi:hypothetical protein
MLRGKREGGKKKKRVLLRRQGEELWRRKTKKKKTRKLRSEKEVQKIRLSHQTQTLAAAAIPSAQLTVS